ncbi:MAG TPA: YaaA family protein [Bacilli bacterium]|nr:YaaA family protein [Bacilli bacterium]
MKLVIFIAPSKTFNLAFIKGTSSPLFMEKSAVLKSKLLDMSAATLQDKMGLSPKLAQQVYDYLREPTSGRASSLFSGVSYKAMELDKLNVKNDKLYIIDALYGLVRPHDNISRYRLDFTMRFLGNLYDYWQNIIAEYLNTHHQDDVLIDLTSHEFSSLIPSELNVIRVDFAVVNKKISSVLLKQMRGKMTRYLIENNINNLLELKQIKIEGFSYCPQSSNNNNFIFTRQN